MAARTEWLNINVTAALHWGCFTTLYQTSEAWKKIEGWKVCIGPTSHFWVLRVVLVCAECSNKYSMSYWIQRLSMRELCFLTISTGFFLLSTHFIAFSKDSVHVLTCDLFAKCAAVVLNQHSTAFTLLQSIDNDISRICSIVISVGPCGERR